MSAAEAGAIPLLRRLASLASTAFVAASFLALAWIALAGVTPGSPCADLAYRDPATGRAAALPPGRVTPEGRVVCR